MEEQLVSYSVAKLAKEKGFNYFHSKSLLDPMELCTQALLQRWLREVHNIVIIILPYIDCESKDVNWSLQYVLSDDLHNNRYFEIDESDSKNTYEEALEKGLEGALNLIKDES
jgi:hypothetical protein